MEQMMTVVMESINNMTTMITALITKNSTMAQNLKIAHWNENGLGKHSQEIKSFLVNQNIDILLVSETHFTSKSFMKIPRYTITILGILTVQPMEARQSSLKARLNIMS
jgi:hypothetical protein